MRAILPALAAVALGVPPAEAQAAGARRAFEPALTLSISAKQFGTRLEGAGAEYRYKNSPGLSVWTELPLTRRTGLLATVNVTPFSKQRVEGGPADNVAVYDRVVTYGGDVGLGARLKPAAPVFFFLGGGLVAASEYADPRDDGGVVEPQGTFAVGYDARPRGAWNLRAVYTGHLVMPADGNLPDTPSASTAYDWSFQLGGRYTFGLSGISR
jgi:hypothetical protein